jgi:hypothetical protein
MVVQQDQEKFPEAEASKPGEFASCVKVERVRPNDKWSEYPSIYYENLTAYALHVYRRLQELGERHLQSLHVGRRLDIGVAPEGKRFFVNELTRWYGALHFALQTQPEPGDKICQAYVKAYAETRGIEPRTSSTGKTKTKAPSNKLKNSASKNRIVADSLDEAPTRTRQKLRSGR